MLVVGVCCTAIQTPQERIGDCDTNLYPGESGAKGRAQEFPIELEQDPHAHFDALEAEAARRELALKVLEEVPRDFNCFHGAPLSA